MARRQARSEDAPTAFDPRWRLDNVGRGYGAFGAVRSPVEGRERRETRAVSAPTRVLSAAGTAVLERRSARKIASEKEGEALCSLDLSSDRSLPQNAVAEAAFRRHVNLDRRSRSCTILRPCGVSTS